MPRSTRRQFLQVLATPCVLLASASGARASQRGLDQFLIPAPPCKDDLTPAVPAGKDYRAGAPMKKTLVEPGMTGTRMTLSGYVSGLACGRVKGARVDFWQADDGGKIDMTGFRMRGAVTTDAEGKYSIETMVPGAPAGKARRIGARVQPAGKAAFTTVLFFPDDPSAQKDASFKPLLLLKQTGTGATRTYTFDFLLDL